jgi:hypothetical protein
MLQDIIVYGIMLCCVIFVVREVCEKLELVANYAIICFLFHVFSISELFTDWSYALVVVVVVHMFSLTMFLDICI